MKSMFPDQAVAITGFPIAIASVMVRPVPSERCKETYASQAAIRSRISCGPIGGVNRDRIALGRGCQRCKVFCVRLCIDALDDEPDSIRRREGFLECLNQGKRVLSLEVTMKIKNEKVDKLFAGHAQPASAVVSRAQGSTAKNRGD